MRRALVVGGGLAGLAAALELTERGWQADLIERSRLLGGKATSFTVDGHVVDNGQHVHLACCTEYVDLVSRCGLEGVLHVQERFDVRVLRRGSTPARLRAGRLPAPLHLAASFLGYGAMGLTAKLAVARALLAARRDVPPAGETAAGWLDRHRQPGGAITAFWEPFIVPALNARLDEAGADALLFVVRTAFLADAGAARIGWSRVPLGEVAEAIGRRLAAVHRQTAVTGLLGGPAGVSGVVTGSGTMSADAVVLAVPPGRLARILADPGRYGLAGLDAVRSEPIVDVHLWYDAPVADLDFAALLGSPVQWVFQKAPGYLACSLSAAREVVGRPEAELVGLCIRELEAVLPSLRGSRLLSAAATRDPDATFVPTPGLLRPAPGVVAPGLAICGSWTQTGWPATMEGAVRSGRSAARAIAAAAVEERAVA